MNNEVDFVRNELDWTVLALATMGFSNRCIENYTGFTSGQVNYRITKGGVSQFRKNYRDGTADLAKRLMKIGLGKADAKTLTRAMNKELKMVS